MQGIDTENRRSREGAWIEMLLSTAFRVSSDSRSREGAWIEIVEWPCRGFLTYVAPARDRGLKLKLCYSIYNKNIVAPARERGLKSCTWLTKDFGY